MSRRFTAAVASLAVAVAVALPAPAQEKESSDVRAKADAAFQAKTWPESAELYAKVVAATPDDGTAWHHLGYSLHMIGKLDEALKAHIKAAEFMQYAGIASYNAACAYSLKNQPDVAFEWLQKAVDSGFNAAQYLDTDTDLDNIRKDARFAKIKKEAASSNRQQAFIATTPRASTRLAFFGQTSNAGQLAIDYGQPAWLDDFGTAAEFKKYAGQRWRLGQDFWTSLDASFDFTLGGVPVKAGQYFLAMKQSADGAYTLELLDAPTVRAAHLDAFGAQNYAGASIAVPMQFEKTGTITKQLQFQITHASEGKGALSILFGPYKASAPLVVSMPKSEGA